VVLARDQPNHLLKARSTAIRRDVMHTVHDLGLRLVYWLVAASAEGVCRPAAQRAQTTLVNHRASPVQLALTPEAVLSADDGSFLTTVLITDIVDSTQTVARLGDERWRWLLGEHYVDCRARVDRAGGRLVNTTGDGILAIFDAPGRAVRAAIAIQAVARASGLAVRAGVHTGECSWLADTVAGLAVHIAARICALGKADEVMASATVRGFATESVLSFEPEGRHKLKGVPGEWTVFKAGELAPVSLRRRATCEPPRLAHGQRPSPDRPERAAFA